MTDPENRNMEIYLDNSATTKTSDAAAALMMKIMTQDYGNPSSLHQKGIDAEHYVKEARSTFAGLLKTSEKELFFTSGGTESDNWAVLKGAQAMSRKGNRILCLGIEHPAVLEPVRWLEKQGFNVIYLPVDEEGMLRLDALEDALTSDTILVSTMLVNNEVGSIQPVAKVSALIREKAPEALFFCDAVQAFGKIPLRPKHTGIDLLSISSHKLHGPKGTGLLYCSSAKNLPPLILGGGQQWQMRSGTENVPGIAGFALAAKEACDNLSENAERLYGLKESFVKELQQLPDVVINGPLSDREKSAPHIVNASFLGIRSEVMLHSLEEQGIYVSAGSACSSHKKTGSDTLRAMGLPKDRLESALRFSFSKDTTKEELDRTLEALSTLLPQLRRFVRR